MTNQSELRETAVLFANRIGSPWGEGATYDRSRTEPEDPDDIDEDDRKPSGKLYSHLSDEDFDLFVADFVAYITADRKRVALEARIHEIGLMQHQARVNLKTSNAVADWGDIRIAELKAQQEEV